MFNDSINKLVIKLITIKSRNIGLFEKIEIAKEMIEMALKDW